MRKDIIEEAEKWQTAVMTIGADWSNAYDLVSDLKAELVEARKIIEPFADVAFGRDSLKDTYSIEIYSGSSEFSPGWHVKRARLLMKEFRRAAEFIRRT